MAGEMLFRMGVVGLVDVVMEAKEEVQALLIALMLVPIARQWQQRQQ